MDKTSYILKKFPNKTPNSSGTIHTICPFHNDYTPSFSINVYSGLFICGSVSCGVRGSFPYFYKLMEKIESWKDVFKDLKGITTNFEFEDIFEKSKKIKKDIINDFPSNEFLEDLAEVDYLIKRKLGKDIVEMFGLKYGLRGFCGGISIKNSIVIPVWDIDNKYKTFQVRYLTDDHKKRWKNPVGSPIQSMLYGGWLISSYSKYLWVVEGASDVWNMFNLGEQAVGLNTKEPSASQLNKIKVLCDFYNLIPIICLDGDASKALKVKGLSFSQYLFNELSAFGLDCKIVDLDYDEDPGGLSLERLIFLKKGIDLI